ncbi:MAG: prolipoprotein diacylglyceryl transferase family protein [Synechococcales bacterium]|nr:prolipoprotein diacylglyceryl transferase family protein [Synechococcales bacterium]
MQFPVYLSFGSVSFHPHPVLEAIAYAVALRLSLRNFRQDAQLGLSPEQRTWVIVGGLLGGVCGAKILVLLQHLDLVWTGEPIALLGLLAQGKTVVGGLLGAIAGVELTKVKLGVTQATGDAFAEPLILGTAIGRMGCFLTGLSDKTYGIATTLPWGVDFGDGILRHPTQLYEILFLGLLWLGLKFRRRYDYQSGDLFKIYVISYLMFRFCIDFIKPDFHILIGCSAIQIACIVGILIYYSHIPRLFLLRSATAPSRS